MKARKYERPAAFKAALEQRLRNASPSGVEIARRRQLLVFDRFLARVARVLGNAAMLKGGLVLEIRLERARTTRDVDLRLAGSPDDALEQLQQAGRLDLGDFMAFEIQPDPQQPAMRLAGDRYAGFTVGPGGGDGHGPPAQPVRGRRTSLRACSPRPIRDARLFPCCAITASQRSHKDVHGSPTFSNRSRSGRGFDLRLRLFEQGQWLGQQRAARRGTAAAATIHAGRARSADRR